MNIDLLLRRMRARSEAKGFTRVHSPELCLGQRCVFHAPSKHHMRKWEKHLRSNGLIERICKHGVGHPDPDSVEWLYEGIDDRILDDIHGCDGCCQGGEK